tara:strand:+ start:1777 stop:2124 length:348 start_codon:yes stop_codon:yes gene_type:complete
MATLPSVTPTYGAQKRSSPKISSTQFMDGYMHRIKFGMNIDPKEWNLSWINISEADADILTAFFEARASDGASFSWEPPDSSGTSYKFICGSWSKEIPYNSRATIQARFMQVFEP